MYSWFALSSSCAAGKIVQFTRLTSISVLGLCYAFAPAGPSLRRACYFSLSSSLPGPPVHLYQGPHKHGGGMSKRARVDSHEQHSSSDASGKVCIITGVGSAKGIGRALAYTFLRAGYGVGGIDLFPSLETDEALQEGKFVYATADVSKADEVSRAVKNILEALGTQTVSVLINNAGYGPEGGSCTAFLPEAASTVQERVEAFKRFVDVNLTGAFICTEVCVPHMLASGAGGSLSVIHISSTRARMSEPNSEGYAASKGGLCALAHAQAISLADKRVRVNCILPGWIDTGGYAISEADAAFHPAGRVGVPQDVAEMCLFLADGSKSGFVTGQQFVVDGGVTSKMIYPE